ncbi:MAG: alpha/beta hydrolase [Leptolyngbyaceae bacterium]|nr:alpha/beta hydrolase [Leptolyngbyaceae bacterium]
MVKVINVFGTPHAYELVGPTQSPFTLVFIHGWLLSRLYWQPLVQQLSQSYQCLTYDLRGFGESQPINHSHQKLELENRTSPQHRPLILDKGTTRSGYTPSAYAHDLIALLTHLNIDQAWLIGHSLGGSIALWASAQSSQRILGTICVNSGGGIYLKEEFEQFRAIGKQLVKLRPSWLGQIPFMDYWMARMNVATPIERRWGKQRLLDWVRANPDAALHTLMDSTTEEEVHQLPQLVARLRQPAYFIAGAKDMVMEPRYVNHLASFHPLFQNIGKNVSELPNCGHLAMVEQPEQLSEHVLQILATHSETA